MLICSAALLLPLALIFMNTGLDFLRAAGAVSEDAEWFQVLSALGESPVALLISVLVALFVLGTRRGEHGTALEKVIDSSLGPVASVILITGAGGMFGGILRASGIGDALASSLDGIGLPVIFAAYIIAVVLRLAQGSATVALVTAAGLMAPAVAAGNFNSVEVAAVVLATGARYRRLDLPRYAHFEGQGIHYAATAMEAQLCTGAEVIVVGGGISARHEDFLPRLRLDTRVVPAELRNAAGIIGAARHAYLAVPPASA